jgi:hypothetical protein
MISAERAECMPCWCGRLPALHLAAALGYVDTARALLTTSWGTRGDDNTAAAAAAPSAGTHASGVVATAEENIEEAKQLGVDFAMRGWSALHEAAVRRKHCSVHGSVGRSWAQLTRAT